MYDEKNELLINKYLPNKFHVLVIPILLKKY